MKKGFSHFSFSSVSLDLTFSASQKRKGTATHYGPWDLIHYSEAGYQPLDVGVGCSNGEPGGDR
jgi:hypothetical protein